MHSFHIAVPTAFHADLSLDCETTLSHIRYLYQQGVRAVMVCGSTGEQHYRLQAVKFSRKFTKMLQYLQSSSL